MAPPPMFLADDDDVVGVFFSCLFLVITIVGAAYAVIWLRKRYYGRDDLDDSHVGFTLGDLRQLHKSGQLSEEEFQKAKEKIVAAAQRAAARDAKAVNPVEKKPPPGGQ